MMTPAWWGGLPLAVVSFCLHTWPRWFNRYFGVDVWRHIDEALYIRTHKRLNTGHQERYLIDQPGDYPPLLRLILAVFPPAWLDEYQWVIAPAFDFLHNLLLYLFLIALTHDVRIAWLGQMVYMASPLVAMEDSNLTTRSLGALTFTASVLPLALFQSGHGLWWLGIAVVGIAVLCVAHRMSLQALVVIVAVFTLMDRTAWYVGALGAGMLLAILISGGFYLKVLEGHAAMLQFWRQNIQYKVAHQIRGIPKRGEKNPDMVFRINHLLKDSHVITMLASNPWIPVMAVLYYGLLHGQLDGRYGAAAPLVPRLALWAMSLLCAGWAIRCVPAWRFLGEGERYVEYASFPVAVVMSLSIGSLLHTPAGPFVLAGCLIVLLGACIIPIVVMQYLVVLKDVERSVTPAMRRIFEHLNTVTEEVRLFAIPLYLITPSMHFTTCRVVSTDNSRAHLTDIQEFAPYLKRPLREILARYRVNYLFVSERYVSIDELQLNGAAEVVLRSAPFCLLRVSTAAPRAAGAST